MTVIDSVPAELVAAIDAVTLTAVPANAFLAHDGNWVNRQPILLYPPTAVPVTPPVLDPVGNLVDGQTPASPAVNVIDGGSPASISANVLDGGTFTTVTPGTLPSGGFIDALGATDFIDALGATDFIDGTGIDMPPTIASAGLGGSLLGTGLLGG